MLLDCKKRRISFLIIFILLLVCLVPLYRKYMNIYNAGICANSRMVLIYEYDTLVNELPRDASLNEHIDAMNRAAEILWNSENSRKTAESISIDSDNNLEVTGICPCGGTQILTLNYDNYEISSHCNAEGHIPVSSYTDVQESLKWY